MSCVPYGPLLHHAQELPGIFLSKNGRNHGQKNTGSGFYQDPFFEKNGQNLQ